MLDESVRSVTLAQNHAVTHAEILASEISEATFQVLHIGSPEVKN